MAAAAPTFEGGTKITAKTVPVTVMGNNDGTLGAWVLDSQTRLPVLLTNSHVLQPKSVVALSSNKEDVFAAVTRRFDPKAELDAAIAAPEPKRALAHATKQIGAGPKAFQYREFAAPQNGEAVKMFGGVSGFGTGRVRDTDKTKGVLAGPCFAIDLGDESVNWGQHGDSGSVIVNASDDIVGLYWGISGNVRYAYPILPVAKHLEIEPLA